MRFFGERNADWFTKRILKRMNLSSKGLFVLYGFLSKQRRLVNATLCLPPSRLLDGMIIYCNICGR